MGTTARYATLDWLRGVAALLVFALHVSRAFGTGALLFAHGYLAVDLFFVLSGFVVAEAYEPGMAVPGGRRRFVVRRIVRLYPVAMLGGLVGLVSWATGQVQTHHLLLVLACQLLLVPQLWQGATLFLLNSVHWSLLLEIGGNLTHAAAVRRPGAAALVAVVAGGWLGLVANCLVWGDLSVGYARGNAVGGVARLAFGYAAGVLLSRWHRRGGRLAALPPWLLLPAPLFLLLPGIGEWRFGDLAIVSALPLLVAAAVDGVLPRWAERAAQALGRLSYPLYAIHLPLVLALARVPGGAWGVAAIPLLAWGVAVRVDEPLRRWLLARLGLAPKRLPAASLP